MEILGVAMKIWGIIVEMSASTQVNRAVSLCKGVVYLGSVNHRVFTTSMELWSALGERAAACPTRN